MITLTTEQAQQIEDALEYFNSGYSGAEPSASAFALKVDNALVTIRAARAQEQAEQEPLVRFCPGCGSIGEVDSKYRDCCPDGIKARLVPSRFAEECQGLFNLAIGNVAPVQEPVAWVKYNHLTDTYDTPDGTKISSELADNVACVADVLHIASIRENQRAEQEPVAEIIGFERTNDMRGVKRIPRIKWNVPLWEDESPLQLGNLYAEPVRTKDLTDGQWTQSELFKLAVSRGLLTLHTEFVAAPVDTETKVSWMEGHATSCDISNEAARAVIAKFKEKNRV